MPNPFRMDDEISPAFEARVSECMTQIRKNVPKDELIHQHGSIVYIAAQQRIAGG